MCSSWSRAKWIGWMLMCVFVFIQYRALMNEYVYKCTIHKYIHKCGNELNKTEWHHGMGIIARIHPSTCTYKYTIYIKYTTEAGKMQMSNR